MPVVLVFDMNEIVREFLLETHENLGQLELDLVTLERDPGERETLGRVFRTLHTVKGTAGFLGLAKLQAVGHAGENLLSRLRAGDLAFDAEIATTLLGVVDAFRKILASIEATGQEDDRDYTDLTQALDRLTKRVAGGDGRPRTPSSSPGLHASVASSPPAAQRSIAGPDAPPPAEPSEVRGPAVADTSVRVDVGLLDKLMTLVGELVLARNQVLQFSATQEDAPFLGTVQRLNLLTTELQAGVMKTRMQPVGNVWGKFPRVVRDLAAACGKQVRIDMDGQETELDRTIVEAVRDPLTHLVRNAVDHGIEPPSERAARGKPAEGRLLLHACHEGGKVVIEIGDDGGGIDPTRVRDKAVRAGLVSPEQAARMSERELVNLVFLPGFSTADRVTHFSGRGVGMDVVRTNVEKIGGTVDVESRPGRGTSVRMKIPLTLAIIPALTVTTGGDRYAIPQVSLLELVRLGGDRVREAVEFVHGVSVYRLRGNLLPLVYLDRLLQVESARRDGGELLIVVLQSDDCPFGLVVDDVHDTEEIVVKPLQKPLKGIGAFAGATIMGDGRVALILDIPGLAQRAGVVSGVRERAQADRPPSAVTAGDRQIVLLFATTRGERMAVPLSAVARLEEVPGSAVERVGGHVVIQYRGQILPLVHVARALGGKRKRGGRSDRSRQPRRDEPARAGANDTIPVVVTAGPGRPVGLIVGRVIDIVEEVIVTRSPPRRPGVLFTAVVQGRVTEFLDVEWTVRSAGPAFAGVEPAAGR